MRVAILHFLDTNNSKDKKVINNLSKALEKNNHSVTVLNGIKDMDNVKLPIYQYIFVIAKPVGFFSSKINEYISNVLASHGTLIGMKSSALILKSSFEFLADKACCRLMSAMEKEGMFVNNFSVVTNADHATYFGKKLC